MKYAICIEFEIDDELTNGDIERVVLTSLGPFIQQYQAEVIHLEASRGSLERAFGVGGKK